MLINPLFPCAVITCNKVPIDDSLIDKIKEVEYRPTGHYQFGKTWISDDTNILPNKYKELIIDTFMVFTKEYYGTVTKFKIGTSWATKTEPHGHGSKHTHSNYFYSGVLYPEDCSSITIHSPYDNRWMLDYNKVTQFNQSSYVHTPKKGDLIFFPSNCRHGIDYNDSDYNRYSIAFNIMPVPPYGRSDSLVIE